MRIAIAADHAGFDLKQTLGMYLGKKGHDILDLGTHNKDSVDYPDYAEALGLALLDRRADRGVMVCGSGVGASVAVNKLSGMRAGVCHDTYSAHQGVEHDDMNVLVLGGRIIGPALAQEIVDAFVQAEFSGNERHARRLEKVKALERRYGTAENPG